MGRVVTGDQVLLGLWTGYMHRTEVIPARSMMGRIRASYSEVKVKGMLLSSSFLCCKNNSSLVEEEA
eukprot:9804314-Prorocentrum_lima.AAC.1